jgi:hypothetical protein
MFYLKLATGWAAVLFLDHSAVRRSLLFDEPSPNADVISRSPAAKRLTSLVMKDVSAVRSLECRFDSVVLSLIRCVSVSRFGRQLTFFVLLHAGTGLRVLLRYEHSEVFINSAAFCRVVLPSLALSDIVGEQVTTRFVQVRWFGLPRS